MLANLCPLLLCGKSATGGKQADEANGAKGKNSTHGFLLGFLVIALGPHGRLILMVKLVQAFY